MQHPLLNRLLGIAFFVHIAIAYVLVVPITELWLWMRNRKQDLSSAGHWYFTQWLFPLFRCMPILEGAENIPKNRSFVVISNHQSFLDIGTLMVHIWPVAFLAKKELFRMPFFGRSLGFMGCIPIDRGNRTANAALPQTLRSMIQKGFNYCVYPEGTRSPTGELLPFKKGIFSLIHEAPVPIVPVTIIGTRGKMPKQGLAFYPNAPATKVVVHPVIEPEIIANLSPEQLRDMVREMVGSALN